jgi:ribosome biogenesis GTPase
MPAGGNLIDSPGIREFGLWHIDQTQLLHSFVEFRPFLAGCRFRDCKHDKEPGCQLRIAVENGAISPQRLASYLFIRSTLGV